MLLWFIYIAQGKLGLPSYVNFKFPSRSRTTICPRNFPVLFTTQIPRVPTWLFCHQGMFCLQGLETVQLNNCPEKMAKTSTNHLLGNDHLTWRGGYVFFLKKYSDSQCCWKKYCFINELICFNFWTNLWMEIL
jgi:hypothetical protein